MRHGPSSGAPAGDAAPSDPLLRPFRPKTQSKVQVEVAPKPRLDSPSGWVRGRRRTRPLCATLDGMPGEPDRTIVGRLSRQGEQALGRITEELVANPVVGRAVTGALEARERAVQAQEAAMGALNIPSAGDVERLTRRLRSVSQRLEGIEDVLDRLEERAIATSAAIVVEDRTPALEVRLEEIARDLAALREAVAPGDAPVPRAQERLTVAEARR